MKNSLFALLLIVNLTSGFAQVGIGTTTPQAFFNVPFGKTVLFGNDSSGRISSSSIFYPKLIWYGSKGAFRAGGVSGATDSFAAWDKDNTGSYSFAGGLDTQASGSYATSLGYRTAATNVSATSMGYYTNAKGSYATSMGYFTGAIGSASTSMGFQTTASGGVATAMGFTTNATGDYSTSMGATVSTNGMTGSFIVGDWHNTSIYESSASNQMMMRFAGGYVLYTSSPTSQSTALGVQLASNSNAWQTLSDSTRKENFRAADGALFLQKIAQMRLGSWNYKGQEAKLYRHYGPMAQDFFTAFGHDAVGTIGEDKSINQADFDGVNLIAIQALIKKVEKLEAENAQQRATLAAYEVRFSKLESVLNVSSTQAAITVNNR